MCFGGGWWLEVRSNHLYGLNVKKIFLHILTAIGFQYLQANSEKLSFSEMMQHHLAVGTCLH